VAASASPTLVCKEAGLMVDETVWACLHRQIRHLPAEHCTWASKEPCWPLRLCCRQAEVVPSRRCRLGLQAGKLRPAPCGVLLKRSSLPAGRVG
jgi:hypothetical protein